jgi:hypothetical protein
VIAEAFPKPRFVVRHKCHTLHPLGALPQIKMRNKKSCRTTVFRREICTVILECDPSLMVQNIFDRKVG